MKQDLEQLKDEILEYLKTRSFTVFHSRSRAGTSLPVIHWDTAHYPDYRQFLESAREAEVKLIACHHQTLEAEQIDAAVEALADADLPPEEERGMDQRLRELRAYEGATAVVELSFDYQGRVYLFHATTPWWEEFQEIADTVEESADQYEDEEPGPTGGYYSAN